MFKRLLVGIALLCLATACGENVAGAPTATPDLSIPTLAVAQSSPAGETPASGNATPNPTVIDTGGHTLGTGPDDTPATLTPSPTPCTPRHNGWPRYQVRRGDTLFDIARATGSTVAELTRVNCLDRPEALTIGQRIRVPRLPTPTPTPKPNRVTLNRFEISPRPVAYDDDLTISWDVAGATVVYLWAGSWSSGVVSATGSVTRPVADVVGHFAEIRVGIRAVDEEELGDEIVVEEMVEMVSDVSIGTLQITPNPAPSNGVVTVSWSFTGAEEGTLYWMPEPYDDILYPFNDGIDPSGSVEVQLPDEFAPIQFRLEAIDGNDLRVTRDVTLNVTCPYNYFADDPANQVDTCPAAPPVSITGSFQPFQGGFMTWESDSDRIVVYLADGTLYGFDDPWDGEPIGVGDDPPPGLYRPERGFGLVWSSDEELRDSLGWATAPESGYELQKQQIYQKFNRYGVNTGAWYLTLPEGNVVGFHADYAHEDWWWWVN